MKNIGGSKAEVVKLVVIKFVTVIVAKLVLARYGKISGAYKYFLCSYSGN